jgi:hypothetical protein
MVDFGDVFPPLTLSQRARSFVRRNWWVLVGIAAGIAIVAYVAEFAPGVHWRFSRDTEDWARLGEYLGGVFGVFAFAGVLITIELQRRQLSQLTDQATIDELHRICRDLASSIDDSIDGELLISGPVAATWNSSQLPSTMRGILEKAKQANDSNDLAREIVSGIVAEQYGPMIKGNMDIAGPELDLLATCIQDAQIRGGSPVILAFYRERYGEIVRRMTVLGYELRSSKFWLEHRRDGG